MNEENSKKENQLISLITLGESSVGKTSLICRYVDNSFENSVISTVGLDFKLKHLTILGKKLTVKIWDTAGQERYNTIQYHLYKNINGILLTFDLTNTYSFEQLSKWYEQIQNQSQKNCIIVLIGNKNDLNEEIKISEEKANEFAKEHSLKYFPISCKSGFNVNEVFDYLITEIVKNQPEIKNNIIIAQTKIKQHKSNKKINCCL